LQGAGDFGTSGTAIETRVGNVTFAKIGGGDVYLHNTLDAGVTVSGTASGIGPTVEIHSRNLADTGDAAVTIGASNLVVSGLGSARLSGSNVTLTGAVSALGVILDNSGTV